MYFSNSLERLSQEVQDYDEELDLDPSLLHINFMRRYDEVEEAKLQN